MKRAIFFSGFLIALPAIALCIVGAFFLVWEVPKLARVQKQAVTRQYREVAEAMLREGQRPRTPREDEGRQQAYDNKKRQQAYDNKKGEAYDNKKGEAYDNKKRQQACDNKKGEAYDNKSVEFGPRQKGWRQTGKIDKRIPWGHVACETGEIVWVGEDAGNVAQTVVARPEMVDVVTVVYGSVIGALAIVIALTGVGIWYFVRNEKERHDFLSATAHDLTTPLVAMGRLIGKDDAYATLLNERMLRLVKNITDFLKLGGKRPKPVCSAFSVGSVFFEAYALFADDFAEETSGPVAVEGDVGVEVWADKLLTLQIVWNLLGNDLKYAAPYGPVTVKIGEAGGMVTLSFVDAGRGMTRRQRKHAFDRYYRAKTVLQSGKGGFGIGLCTAREFARAMGGDLTVGENAPRGCVFTLALRRRA